MTAQDTENQTGGAETTEETKGLPAEGLEADPAGAKVSIEQADSAGVREKTDEEKAAEDSAAAGEDSTAGEKSANEDSTAGDDTGEAQA